jgi:glycerol-3-phosphate dehydrogenase
VLYDDAQTDDARLVLSLLQEAQAAGAAVMNYVRVEQVLTAGGRVRGAALRDEVDGTCREIEAGLVADAAGAAAGAIAGAPAGAPPLRPLRGSHLLFPLARLPLRCAVSWLHPRDRRPVFVYPWQGAALLGTTDVDHEAAASTPLRMSAGEAEYLLEGLGQQFPGLRPRLNDTLSSFAGVRPIVAGGKADPSAESRESAIWSSPGWLGVTGGKLTTFRLTARQACVRQHGSSRSCCRPHTVQAQGRSRREGGERCSRNGWNRPMLPSAKRWRTPPTVGESCAGQRAARR